MFSKMPTRARLLVTALGLMIASAIPSFAQLTEATLKGVVTDAAARVVPTSPVTARSESTGQSRSTITDGDGTFALPGLPPGNYTISVTASGFKTYEQKGLRLSVGQATDLHIQLQVGEVQEIVEVKADDARVSVATDARLSDTVDQRELQDLPIAARDVTGLIRLSAGATLIPGSANSTKLTASPVITVNGNRYRGNNYVLDGSMNTNPNNSGEPAIVPSLESIEEVQVQTGNFSAEFGRGNGSVVNSRTKSGTNSFHGKAWEYLRNSSANARNYFATQATPLKFNQFGGILGGPIIKDKTFFFVSYEGSRSSSGQALRFQVETPEFRDYIFKTAPGSVAASLLKSAPAPTPLAGTGGTRYVGEVDFTPPGQTTPIPQLGTASVVLGDKSHANQYLVKIDHSLREGKDKIIGRWIAENEYDNGGVNSQLATLGQAVRGYYGPFNGFFGNLNLGEVHLFGQKVNDARFSFQDISTQVGVDNPTVPTITITGITAPFGDIPKNGTRLRVYELRDTLSFDWGKHLFRVGGEGRKIFKGLSLSPPTPGAFVFRTPLDFAQDNPFSQSLTVNPITGVPTAFPRYFTLYESGLFIQDDWKLNSHLTLNLGLRHDYFGSASEKHGLLSSLILGPGDTYAQQLASGSIGRVERLFTPQKFNFSPRIGVAYDPFGTGRTSIRAGFSLAYMPNHGLSIAGPRPQPPDVITGVLSPAQGIGTNILYGIPVPLNPAQFARGLNAQGGVPGLQIAGWVVDPHIKTQYSESWFVSVDQELFKGWIAEVSYTATDGVHLERLNDINRVAGDLLNPAHFGKLVRVNSNFGAVTQVRNDVTSSYNGGTAEIRHSVSHGLSFQANYRFSKWIDSGSDTQPGQFSDSSEALKGTQDANCLRCERGHSMFDIPHRFTASVVWSPTFSGGRSFVRKIGNGWELSTITSLQSGRPFSVWNGAPSNLKCVAGSTLTAVPSTGVCTSGTLRNLGGDYNLDGGGGINGGFYDRPNAPAPGTVKSSFSQKSFLTGLFDPNAFPLPALGTDGTLGRFTFRGPHQYNVDLSVARSFAIREIVHAQFRLDAFNALNKANLYLPNSDLSLALKADGTYSTTSIFGQSTRAFDARTLQASLKFSF